ncbi:uncharacterized protein MYCFIDRAFT_147886 [Pseudocercospora fijiensis CIRAD86]|uniref:Phytase A n=1 Tax=Pseudocercospora fijiensis (strain CIRAD86) TaxID=383855 RepID=N1Q5K3_PSEFD|nr:uncharacterized protein MYCFIDRAFT_147886 [Pseudocercospora fijiensis CIRAD86]EME87205.1 hypothetical protein MYCFIDRAFT_147886 [Pseudocercospora fijiensis CIRAD86]
MRFLKPPLLLGSGRPSSSHHGGRHQYALLDQQQRLWSREIGVLFIMVVTLAAVTALVVSGSFAHAPAYAKASAGCDSVQSGYQCQPQISPFWGPYSPFFSVPSSISSHVPRGCTVTFANILSRHGARDPTASKTKLYNATIQKIHANTERYPDKYAFLKDYQYDLGADQLTLFGEQEMINSGTKFYQRYELLANHVTPFIRSSSEDRVLESALNWTQGFHSAKKADPLTLGRDSAYPYPIVVISEAEGSNNTLSHDLCTSFENGPDSTIAANAQKTWADTFVPAIQTRINNDLQGANLTTTEIIYLMDLCPFDTVASPNGRVSPFCALFTETEWHQYGYYETLNKYYGYSYGNPLGPTQGVGYANELIARLTNKAVDDATSTNHTLDDNPATFPLRRGLYADFSHDNDMTAIFSALGLYNGTEPLSNRTLTEADHANGFSAAYTVPFAARAYFEKMLCVGKSEEQVRVIINDRVLPLQQCGGDRLGRCSLGNFVDSLGFAKSGGHWDQCFT